MTPGGTTTLPINTNASTLLDVLVVIINRYVIFFVSAAVVLGVVYAGILFMTSSGDPERVLKAKRALLYSVIATIIFSLFFGVMNFIKKFF